MAIAPKEAPSVRYPGIPATQDGSGAVVWVETHVTQGACAYPITPSTPMGVGYAEAVARGTRNLWGEPLAFLEPESEHSSASAAEGFALAGGRVSNFTSGQGLVLMKEVLYTIAGKRLPVVFNIGARALTSQSLNVHAGHDDVMAVADAGWGMLFATNAQGAADLCLIARRAAEACETPFLNIQDGFLTTHTVESVLLPEPEFMREYLGPPGERLRGLFDPEHPVQSGVVQNQDSYMKGKVAQRFFTASAAAAVEEAMEAFAAATGRRYRPVEPYRMEDAEVALVAMGSMAETAMATVDYLRRGGGPRCGVVHVTCFRPFPGPELVRVLARVRALAAIERLDVPMAQSNPLAAELKAAFADALARHPGYPEIEHVPPVLSGVAGLGSRDVRPADFVAAVRHLVGGDRGRRFFVLGIRHPDALAPAEGVDVRPPGTFSMRGHSVGGYGSVATNKTIATVVARLFGLRVQAYPKYGGEKKGLPTAYFLTVSREPIRTHCELERVDFVPLNNTAAFRLGDPLVGITTGGTVFLQSAHEDPEAVWADVPPSSQRAIREKQLRLLYLDAAGIAAEVSTRPELQTRMQGIVLLGVFLRTTPFAAEEGLSEKALLARVEEVIEEAFGKAGKQVVRDNMTCVRRGFHEVREVPRAVIEGAAATEASA